MICLEGKLIKNGTNSLTPIAGINERIRTANKNNFQIDFEKINVAKDYKSFLQSLKKFKPNVIIQFGEQRATPYSMKGDLERRYTVDNNVTGTHNICSAIVEVDKNTFSSFRDNGVMVTLKGNGTYPEGYLDITINETGAKKEILFPTILGAFII